MGHGHRRELYRLTTRAAGIVAAVALAPAALSGCSGSKPSGHLGDALALVPTSATQVLFADPAAAKKRWGLTEVNGSTPLDDPKFQQYVAKARNSPAVSNLARHVDAMKGWGWNGLDVDWQVSLTPRGSGQVTISKLRDGLKMKTVVASLESHRFIRTGPDDAPHFTRPLSQADPNTAMPELAAGVTVRVKDRLLIQTSDRTFALPDEADSWRRLKGVAVLTKGLDNPGFAAISLAPTACVDRTKTAGIAAPTDRPSLTPDAGPAGNLKSIDAAAAAVTDDDHAHITTLYPDEATAKADLDARRALLNQATSLRTGRPYSTSFTAEITTEDARMTYRLTLTGQSSGGQPIADMARTNDAPWAFCP